MSRRNEDSLCQLTELVQRGDETDLFPDHMPSAIHQVTLSARLGGFPVLVQRVRVWFCDLWGRPASEGGSVFSVTSFWEGGLHGFA